MYIAKLAYLLIAKEEYQHETKQPGFKSHSDRFVFLNEVFLDCHLGLHTVYTSDVVETLMVETETKTETWKKFESKTRDQDLKKFSRPRSRLGEFFETETRLRDPRF